LPPIARGFQTARIIAQPPQADGCDHRDDVEFSKRLPEALSGLARLGGVNFFEVPENFLGMADRLISVTG
jgi:hypothetical protein